LGAAPRDVIPPPSFLQAVQEGTRTADGLPGPKYWTNTAEYTLKARVDAEQKHLDGSGRIVYHNNSPDTLHILALELTLNVHRPGAIRDEEMETSSGVTLNRVTIDGQTLQALKAPGTGYNVNDTRLVIYPPSPVLPGQTVNLDIGWSFDIPQRGASGRMGYSRDNLVYLAYWYPTMDVYDDVVGWSADFFRGTGEFYHDYGDYDVTIDAPAGWIVNGTGTLQNPDETLAQAVADRMRQAHESDEPVMILRPEDYAGRVTQPGANGRVTWHLTAQHVSDFAFGLMRDGYWEGARTSVGDRDGDGQTDYTAINAFYRESAPLWDHAAEYEQDAITFLSRFTGFSYPWPHMTAVEGSDIIGGGMEYPMMTLIGSYNGAGGDALYSTIAHELAHMWIPMIVAVNERRYGWMDEGSTTFAENQARANRFPGRDNQNLGDQQNYLRTARRGLEGEIMRWSDYQYSSTAYVTASYYKPATVLTALRAVLGEATFNRAYQSFIDTWAYKHPYPYDLFNTFERVSGRDLDWFWNTWYFRTWTLDQAIHSVTPGPNGATIVVENEGQAPMPVLLAITTASGDTLHREIPVDNWLRGATQATLTVDTTSPLTRVEIDPGYLFPDIDRKDNVWEK
ncbi:MAG TPA: M1 family metallopeptidase, partial [Rhodothermales bacterium]|nr:M1 family metallopeptidase [Rhodothermales bacterium]